MLKKKNWSAFCVIFGVGGASMWWSDCPYALWLVEVAWSATVRTRCIGLILFAKQKKIGVYTYKSDAPEQIMTLLMAYQTWAAANKGEFIVFDERKRQKKCCNEESTQRFQQFFMKSDIGPSHNNLCPALTRPLFDVRVLLVGVSVRVSVRGKSETKIIQIKLSELLWSTAATFVHLKNERCLVRLKSVEKLTTWRASEWVKGSRGRGRVLVDWQAGTQNMEKSIQSTD